MLAHTAPWGKLAKSHCSGPLVRPGAKRLIAIIAAAVLLCAYPAFVLAYTWSHVLRSGLPGGRHGPLDAYRHTLASAVVAFTVGPSAVEWTTQVMERGTKLSSVMDRHDNRIGAGIGPRARSLSEIEPTVRAHVDRGMVNAPDPAQTTWLPPEHWRAGRLW